MLNKCILITLSYAQIFNDSLTINEVYRWLIFQKTTKPLIEKKLQILVKSGKIYQQNGRYSLSRKSDFNSHKQILNSKLSFATQATGVLKFIPTIRLIAVSGSVAASRPDKKSDIDFFIICQKDSVWITRLFCNLFLLFFKQKRNRRSQVVNNKICLNMYIDEANTLIQPKNIYYAREILQIIPLLNRNQTYEKFLKNNQWTSKIFPNACMSVDLESVIPPKTFLLLKLTDWLFFRLQYLYMLQHLTIEKVSASQIRFHPIDYHSITLRKFKQVLNAHNIKITESERKLLFGRNIDKKN